MDMMIILIVIIAAVSIFVPTIWLQIRKSQSRSKRRRRRKPQERIKPWIRWAIGLAITCLVVLSGYKMGMEYLSNTMIDKIAAEMVSPEEIEVMKRNPEIRKTIEENFTPEEVEKIYANVEKDDAMPASDTNEAYDRSDVRYKEEVMNPMPSAYLTEESARTRPVSGTKAAPAKSNILSKEAASELMLSKFSMGELTSMADQAKDGLTIEEKKEIKGRLLERISEDEFQEIKKAALIEIVRRESAK